MAAAMSKFDFYFSSFFRQVVTRGWPPQWQR
jgi:hypothetical protein